MTTTITADAQPGAWRRFCLWLSNDSQGDEELRLQSIIAERDATILGQRTQIAGLESERTVATLEIQKLIDVCERDRVRVQSEQAGFAAAIARLERGEPR
jgi:hypothetical protein